MKNNIIIVVFISLILGTFSCNDEEFLKEVPLDFISPENAMVTKANFEAALLNVYRSDRGLWCGQERGNNTRWGMDSDVFTRGALIKNDWFWAGSRKIDYNTLNPDNPNIRQYFDGLYRLILGCNFVITRADGDQAQWESEEEKNAIVGEARFLRAYYYTILANLYGGVPLVLEETKTARFDYERATQEEVYMQCKEDLEFAGKWMNSIDIQQSGRAPRAAAFHQLTEVLIQLGDYDGAIAAATKVIDGTDGVGAYALMTERFGTYKDFKFEGWDYQGEKEPWGDVFWDLFRMGNQNRGESGNTETIWNVQFDPNLEGGGVVGENVGWYIPLVVGYGSNWWIRDRNNVPNYYSPVFGERTVGNFYLSEYGYDKIWEYKDGLNTDMRTSTYNIKRESYWTNPDSEFYGQLITEENSSGHAWNFGPYISPPAVLMKVFMAENHWADRYMNDEPSSGGRLFTDYYLMRLAETYLLRAEAYMRKGDKQSAADDINVVRSRANANPADAADIDEDFILDERARELSLEEFRASTLARMNRLADRLMKYNEEINVNGWVIPDYKNKWPIPNSFIEVNNAVEIQQNPGY